jgi:ABC-type Mn2+/Zn2+ transport system permease subunit
MMAFAALLAVAASAGGLYLSYYADTAGGASVALCLVGGFLLALLVSIARSWRATAS